MHLICAAANGDKYYVQELADSMPERLRAVIEAAGGPTRW